MCLYKFVLVFIMVYTKLFIFTYDTIKTLVARDVTLVGYVTITTTTNTRPPIAYLLHLHCIYLGYRTYSTSLPPPHY